MTVERDYTRRPLDTSVFNSLRCSRTCHKIPGIDEKNLRGNTKLVLPVAKTTTYGLKSTSYITAKAWNALPDNLTPVAEFARLRNELRKLRIL